MNTSPDAALIKAAQELRSNNPEGWAAFALEHPEVAAAAEPKLDAGVGSDATRLAPGICWRGDDKQRVNRRPAPPIDPDLKDSSFVERKPGAHGLGVCEVCRKRLPSGWEDTGCEFGVPIVGCRCGGCKPWPKKTKGRPRYCSDECKAQMHNALRRAQRASDGKTLRASAVDPIAMLKAEYKVGFRDRARQSRESAASLW